MDFDFGFLLRVVRNAAVAGGGAGLVVAAWSRRPSSRRIRSFLPGFVLLIVGGLTSALIVAYVEPTEGRGPPPTIVEPAFVRTEAAPGVELRAPTGWRLLLDAPKSKLTAEKREANGELAAVLYVETFATDEGTLEEYVSEAERAITSLGYPCSTRASETLDGLPAFRFDCVAGGPMRAWIVKRRSGNYTSLQCVAPRETLESCAVVVQALRWVGAR